METKKEGLDKPNDFIALVLRYRYQITIVIIGLILAGLGAYLLRNYSLDFGSSEIEIIETETNKGDTKDNTIVVEIAGAVNKPGVYSMREGSRIEDLLTSADGLSEEADHGFLQKNLNRAAHLTDGIKVYIPHLGENPDQQSSVLSANKNEQNQSGSLIINQRGSDLVNVNSASQKELEELPGIGPVYASNIIEQRPYSDLTELVSKGALKPYVYEKIKDQISVY